MPNASTRVKRLFILWCIAVLLGSSTSIATWSLQITGPIQSLSNFFYMFALPGWIPLYLVGLAGIRDNPMTIILANAIAWTGWCIGLWILLTVLDRVRKWSEESAVDEAIDDSRRSFMTKGVLGIGALGAVASPGYATLVEPWQIKVRRYTVPIRGLPQAFDGLRVVQFSDSHLGPRIPESFIRHAVQQTADLRPDLLVLTGDYIHDGGALIDQAAELCKPMIDASRLGTLGVLGNHDWWGDGPRMSRALQAQGVRMIDNDRVWLDPQTQQITDEPNPDSLAIIGLGDLDEDTTDIKRAFRDVHQGTPRLLLAHQPDTAELGSLKDIGAPRVDLMFSGHTHGGQVRIPLIGTPIVPSNYGSKYAGGLVQAPRFPVVVSRGIGMSLLPLRFGVPPEIVEVTLTRA